MTILTLTVAVLVGSVLAGLIGSLTGLGGGLIITPLLTLALGVDIHYALGAALVSVIATSCGAASAYVKEGFSNLRLGMFMEVATTTGAVLGASLASYVSVPALGVFFGLVLLFSAISSFWPRSTTEASDSPNRTSQLLAFDSTYPTAQGSRDYHVQHVLSGTSVMFGAGILSGLLGIGSGAFKVIALDKIMRLPFKVSTTTSNFMIGVTAAASAGLYFKRGYIDPVLGMPVVLGVLVGSFLGARVLPRMKTILFRQIFAVVIALLAVEMLYHGLTGQLK